MFYGQQTWDPVLICSQILAVQALWYLSLGSLLWLLLGALIAQSKCQTPGSVTCASECDFSGDAGPYVAHLTLHHLFDWRLVNVHSFTGWMIIVATLFNALAASTYLMALVRTMFQQRRQHRMLLCSSVRNMGCCAGRTGEKVPGLRCDHLHHPCGHLLVIQRLSAAARLVQWNPQSERARCVSLDLPSYVC